MFNIFKKKPKSQPCVTNVKELLSGNVVCKVYEITGERKTDYINVGEFVLDTVTVKVKAVYGSELGAHWFPNNLHPDDNGCITLNHSGYNNTKILLVVHGVLR